MVLKRAEEQAQITESLQGTMVVDEMHSLTSARVECARDEADATFAKEKLGLMTQESEKIANYSDYKGAQYSRETLRESTQNVQRTEDETRRLSIEIQAPVVGVLMAKGFTALKTHRMYLCPLGVILLVNNLDNSGTLSDWVAAFDFDSCLVNTDVKT
ncbi:hypothetical protein SELMODRAFT_403255 [Selaginella moellendorffii]|uniref:Uncharacterized protein n=1 Tax=Selaginella moellendorffii TaxID=88036 RepID=D8QTK7_SELML|nr:hypothetical protein SELMODRAFT_403255 [Selaginella moellendorffii]